MHNTGNLYKGDSVTAWSTWVLGKGSEVINRQRRLAEFYFKGVGFLIKGVKKGKWPKMACHDM